MARHFFPSFRATLFFSQFSSTNERVTFRFDNFNLNLFMHVVSIIANVIIALLAGFFPEKQH